MGVVLSNCPEDYQRQHEASCRAFPHLRCPWWHGLRDGPEVAKAEGHGELLGRGEHEACHGRHEEGYPKCSHEDAPELSLPPYRSSYRFVNTMINKGDSYENINDMATMFAKMMHEMKNRNSNYQVNSYSRHGDNKMDKMRMMMKMMKMSNMMNNYRSSDYSNQMGRMSHFKNMFNNMRYKGAS